jgi:osmotically-inducible protein OsmY
VWRVDNLLKVRAKEQPTDAQMEAQLKAALAWDPLVESDTITVAVTKHVAHLSGTVDSSFEKAEAQDVASRIKGVLLVRNNLKTESAFSSDYYDYSPYYNYGDWPYYSYYDGGLYNNQFRNYDYGMYEPRLYMTDEQIKTSIKGGFFWSPFVDSGDIKVSVNGGVATLTGTVGTRIGWNEASRDAYNGGATKVVNQVKITHSAWWWWW